MTGPETRSCPDKVRICASSLSYRQNHHKDEVQCGGEPAGGKGVPGEQLPSMEVDLHDHSLLHAIYILAHIPIISIRTMDRVL